MADEATSAGTLETRREAERDQSGTVKLWLDAIQLAGKGDWEKWEKSARDTLRTYSGKDGSANRDIRFNILFNTTQTLHSALYNSTPVPDIRRRNSESPDLQAAEPQQPAPPQALPQGAPPQPPPQPEPAGFKPDTDAKAISQALERTISAQMDFADFDGAMHAAVDDMLLPGRGVTRIRYVPTLEGEGEEQRVVDERVVAQHVQWDSFRHGPAKRWEDVTWIAFQHFLTRDQLTKLSPKIGATIELESTIDGAESLNKGRGDNVPSLFKRAEVWEIWDKETREVLFIAKSHKTAPLTREKDPLQLEGFFPIPRPMLSFPRTDTLVPKPEYELYKAQAEELDDITRRLRQLIRAVRWRGIYNGALESAFGKLKDLADGEFAPADQAAQFGEQGLPKAIWMMPAQELVATIHQLMEAREQIKSTVFEITGISDIQRGASNANETLGAQRIKAEWSSMRLQNRQSEVQRYARDLIRIMADIVASLFSPDSIALASGIRLTPEQIELMRLDVNRGYRVDIETDSTIAADTGRLQENIAAAMNAMSGFMSAITPGIQSGQVPLDVAADLLGAIMRPFKLGRQGEDALDRMAQAALAKSKQPQQAQPDPKVEAEKAKLALEEKRLAMDGERMKMDVAAQQQKQQAESQFKAQDAARAEREAQIEEARKAAEDQRAAERHALEMQGLQAKAALEIQAAQAKAAADQQRYMADQQRAEHDMMCAQEEHQNKAIAFETERATKGSEGKALAAFQQLLAAQAQLMQQQQVATQQQQAASLQHEQAVAAMLEQLTSAIAMLAAPKRVVRDGSGRVAGVEPVTH